MRLNSERRPAPTACGESSTEKDFSHFRRCPFSLSWRIAQESCHLVSLFVHLDRTHARTLIWPLVVAKTALLIMDNTMHTKDKNIQCIFVRTRYDVNF